MQLPDELHPFYSRILRKWLDRPKRPAFLLDNGCLLRQGAISAGYGTDGTNWIHRQPWEAINGPIPPNHDVHHACHQAHCANVDHLMVLTPQEHRQVEDRYRLEAEDVRDILRMLTEGVKQADIARRFGITEPHVSLLKHGRRWRRVVKDYWASLQVIPIRYATPCPGESN
jgi:hypothetical protein